MKRREKWFWILFGAALLIGFLALIPFNGEICEKPDNTGYKECAPHNFPVYLAFKTQKGLDALGVAITALATIAIAWFTWTLRKSTDRLWKAGDEQLKFVKESSAEQAVNMRASIEASRKSAEAAMKAAETAEKSLILEQRPWLIWNIKLPINVFKAGRHIQADVDTIFENVGKTPAMSAAYTARLYVVGKGEPIVNVGIRHLNEMSEEYMRDGGPLFNTNILPSEKPPKTLKFGANIAINDLKPSETGKFQLYLAIHAGYRLFDGGRIAEIGALYMLNAMVPPSARPPLSTPER